MASDNFTGVNGTVLDAHDSNWLIGSGSQALSNATIQSNELETSAFRQVYAYYSGSTTGVSELTLRGGGPNNAEIGPAVDMSGVGKGYAAFFDVESAGNWTRVRLDKDGAFLAQVTGLSFPVASDHVIKITRVDNGANRDLEVFVDTVSQLTHNDSTSPLALANDGIYLKNDSGATAAQIDDWSSATSAGPTITGPNSTTEGAATVEAGTLLDTVTTQSLISGSFSIAQTIDSQTATTLNYVAESGVNLCAPGVPVSGVPLEATISAAGVTPWVVQQEADDGVNPAATRNITLNGEATHEVVQAMIATSNTTPGESVLATSIIAVEDNMQYYAPKVASGMNITWAADGTFTTDADQTETISVVYFSPATGQHGCVSLTIKDTSIISAGIVRSIVRPIVRDIV